MSLFISMSSAAGSTPSTRPCFSLNIRSPKLSLFGVDSVPSSANCMYESPPIRSVIGIQKQSLIMKIFNHTQVSAPVSIISLTRSLINRSADQITSGKPGSGNLYTGSVNRQTTFSDEVVVQRQLTAPRLPVDALRGQTCYIFWNEFYVYFKAHI